MSTDNKYTMFGILLVLFLVVSSLLVEFDILDALYALFLLYALIRFIIICRNE